MKKKEIKENGGTYSHGEEGIGGLEAVGAFLPEVAVTLDGDDIATHPVARLRHQHLPPSVPRRQRLCRAQPTDPPAHHHALHGQPPSRRSLRLAAGHGAVACDGAPDPTASALAAGRLGQEGECRGGGKGESRRCHPDSTRTDVGGRKRPRLIRHLAAGFSPLS